MKFLLTVVFAFFLVGNVVGACTDGCECPDFMSFVQGSIPVQYTQDVGCSPNATCPLVTDLVVHWNETEIPVPDDADSTRTFTPCTHDSWPSLPGNPIEIMAFFGIICENQSWYATKYPKGFFYYKIGASDSETTHYQEEFQGKKSKISGVWCYERS